MVATATAVDPWAHVASGTTINNNDNYPGFNDQNTGMWTRNRYTWCGAIGPVTGKACSRPLGHGAHLAHMAASEEDGARAVFHERWAVTVPDPAQIVASTDPHFEVKVGEKVEVSTADDAAIFGLDTGQWCCAVNPDGSMGMCSRKNGHDQAWPHLAVTGEGNVIGRWGGVAPKGVDPFEGKLMRGTWYRDLRVGVPWDDAKVGVKVRRNQCNAHSANYPRDYGCTRPQGHPGDCCYCDSDQVHWVEPVANSGSLVDETKHDPMAPDGSPPDPIENVLANIPQVGDVVKLRDRARRLYVMGARRGTAQIEVLDLTSGELWAMPITRAVALPEDVNIVDIDELQVITRWYAEHRDAVRKVAVREYRKDRWCIAGLNENLAELGLPQYEPTLSGEIRLTVSFEAADTKLQKSDIETAVREALKDPLVVAQLLATLPPIEGITVDTSTVAITAANLTRK